MTGGQHNPEAITVDQLAERTGMTVRNLREWRTLGLLPAAELRGRVGYYDPSLVDRVKRIRKLHAEGFTLELIRRMLETGGEGAMRLAGALRSPFRAGEPPAAALTEALRGLGLEEDQIDAVLAELRGHADGMAAVFEALWRRHIWEPHLAAGMPEAGLVNDMLGQLQPLALDAVTTTFKVAMETRIEQGIAAELERQRRSSEAENTAPDGSASTTVRKGGASSGPATT